ncbi:MAG: hypothetical protein OQK98_00635 [Gammaproteobacteria bacterium]|nr:hypothetical protein [Gammaproteobacteria bacterium]
MNKEEELNIIKKEITKINIIGTPGAIFLGLGLYALFGAEGEPFHPILNNAKFVLMLLVVGSAIEIWQFTKLMPLFKKQSALNKQ